LKISHLERTVCCVPFLPGILSTPEYDEFSPAYPAPLSERRQDILRIHTDAGLTGIGMSRPYFGDRTENPPALLGKDPNAFEPRTLSGSGWDIALFDLIGKVIDWPLCRIFGGRLQEKVLVDYWIARMNAEDTATAAKRAAALGFHGLKMKCKWEDANMEDRTRAALEVAPDLRIVLDPNERFYTLKNALDLARRLDGLDVVFEDPFPKNDLDEYRRLKEETSVLVAPHFQNPRQIVAAVQLEAIDAFNIAPSDWGFLDMARIAQSADIPVWQASNVDLGVFDAFRLHASAAAPNCTFGSDLCGNFVHEHSLLAEPLVKDGYAIVPEGPGLGVELDEEAVIRYALSSKQWLS
jgi:muconate cycloisomerase